uniref:Glycerophosphodiester phosphodiesterase n=1 Tax=Desulfacinum infernum TaxID=35837 RepID=A0A831ZYL6_9BACT
MGVAEWKDLKKSGAFWVGAHRGGRDLGAENTLKTALQGYRAGADFWELDVQLSADGVPVVIHDDTLVRTTDAATVYPQRAPWRVSDFSEAELAALCPPIPTLGQALAFTKALGWLVNVEIKGTGKQLERLIGETLRAVTDLEMMEAVLISSFHVELLRRLRQSDGRVMIGVLADKVVEDPVGLVRGLGADTFHPTWEAVSEETVRRCRAEGIPVIAWTVNDRETGSRFKSYGVSAVITDRPHEFVALRNHP